MRDASMLGTPSGSYGDFALESYTRNLGVDPNPGTARDVLGARA